MSQEHTAHRTRLPNRQRRIPLNVTLDPSTIDALTQINVNRSAAIEQLVHDYFAKRRNKSPTAP